MPLDTMPPAEGEEFPRLPELEPPLAVTVPHHLSLWCKIHLGQGLEHHPCSGTCDGHGTGSPCGQPCQCPAHG